MPTRSPTVIPTPSPPHRVSRMDFFQAMKEVLYGAKVSKVEWENRDIYVFLDGLLKIRQANGEINDLIVSHGDMIGTDWFII